MECIKDTETFHITGDEWKDPGTPKDFEGNFVITVYKPPKSFVNIVANVIGANKDSSIMRGSGDYYLSINSPQKYTIVIEEKS